MEIVTEFAELERGRPAVLTMGAFDGVHRGHQYLIRQVVDRARRLDYASVVVTFDPRPAIVFQPGSTQLTNGTEKARIMAALGVDILVVLPFDRALAQVPAGQFLLTLREHVNLAEIWVGTDFAFGHHRGGTVQFLIEAGAKANFAVHVVPRQRLSGQNISSTAVRDLLSSGDVAGAAVLLGHYFRLTGTVVEGEGRGAGLGFPTANLAPAPNQFVPGTGIYACRLYAGEIARPAAVSVGYNPQFDGKELTVEAYALDFNGDLRGQPVALDFIARLRGEQRFDSIEKLIAQMHRDVAATRDVLLNALEPGELLLPALQSGES